MNIKLKTQRRFITPSKQRFTEALDRGVALVYRKTKESAGTWTARRWVEGTKYEFNTIGRADDFADADGLTAFSFAQASKIASDWNAKRVRESVLGRVHTVADAATDWLKAWDGSDSGRTVAESNVRYWILPRLGNIPVNELKSKTLQAWLEGIANSAPVKVQRRLNDPAYKKLYPSRQSKIKYDPNDPETKRKRRDTANRVLNDLKAICNRAFKMNDGITSDAAWRKVEKLRHAAQAKEEFLTKEEVQTLLNACEPDFYRLVFGSVATGMRLMEQANMRRCDYSKVNGFGLITIIQPKTGKTKYMHLNASETQFFDELVEGLEHEAFVFTRPDGSRWRKSNQQPRLKAALAKAGVTRHVRWHDLRHTCASLMAAGGAPLAIISKQLGHSSQRMTERYTSLIDGYVSQAVRDSKPVFTAPV